MCGKLQKVLIFAPDGLWKPLYKIYRKPGFLHIGVFTKYRWLNAIKWPQMPQKLIRTISHGPGPTLDTLNHGLGPLFYCFIFFAPSIASTLLAPPGGTLEPLVCHPGP